MSYFNLKDAPGRKLGTIRYVTFQNKVMENKSGQNAHLLSVFPNKTWGDKDVELAVRVYGGQERM